ncbi:HD domain-containing protein [Larkinella arboricola]|uniref:HD domain-containing protein n=1 Tax=Larkinella arboricola TaxID=643671 RepID=A0A327WJY6_LARAB|nr:HD domain-containing protein [Larkinella arboricola]RAJ92103.1 HD domain-containing protein [Larkinella arboricola]
MNLPQAEAFILARLERELAPTLYYHGIHHTRDVVEVALQLARAENITDAETLALLRTAALYHDCGFVTTYQGHEAEGCRYARETLPEFGYTTGQIEQICAMIMATQIPQNPQNLLERILCDADLDYLGRPDFDPIARTLFKELKARNLISDEPTWNRTQVNFLENHQYWTPTANALRRAAKQRQLDHLKEIVSHYPV